MAALKLLCALSNILARDDTPRLEVENHVFNYGSHSSGFQDLLKGTSDAETARTIFGTQLVPICDIVFHHPAYSYTSKDWKAWKLVNMMKSDESDASTLDPDNFTVEDITIVTFREFINACKVSKELKLNKAAVREVKKLCKERVNGLRRKSVGLPRDALLKEIESNKGKKWSLFSKTKSGEKSGNLTVNSDQLSRKRRRSFHATKTMLSSSNPGIKEDKLEALDLPLEKVTKTLSENDTRGRRGTVFGAIPSLKTISEIVISDYETDFEYVATWDNITSDKKPELLVDVEGYRMELGVPLKDEWKPWYYRVIDSHVDVPFWKDKISSCQEVRKFSCIFFKFPNIFF